jgi:DNA mismatch endonuclease (patch repair protein)
MSRVRSKDTKPELIVRRQLWARGYRYRLHRRDLPGRPDLAFVSLRIAVFIDGDMWHGNAWKVREKPSLASLFPTNTEWWVSKIERNMERDRQVTADLEAAGWTVARFWESEVLADAERVVRTITRLVDAARSRQR